jgi:hypothetical protein
MNFDAVAAERVGGRTQASGICVRAQVVFRRTALALEHRAIRVCVCVTRSIIPFAPYATHSAGAPFSRGIVRAATTAGRVFGRFVIASAAHQSQRYQKKDACKSRESHVSPFHSDVQASPYPTMASPFQFPMNILIV